MLYQVTFHGIGNSEALIVLVHDELEKKGKKLCVHVASNRNEGGTRATSSGSRHAISTETPAICLIKRTADIGQSTLKYLAFDRAPYVLQNT